MTTDPTPFLNRRVRGFSASNREETTVEGVVLGFHDEPVAYILTRDGSLVPWAASITEPTGDEVIRPEDHGRIASGRLNYVTIDSPEEWSLLEHNDYGAVVAMTGDPAKFPSEPWVDAFDRVMADADSATCDLSVVTDEATGQMCSNPIGWVLHEDDDEPHRSGMSWRQVTLVWTSEGVAAVCEDCAPDTLYGAAAYLSRMAREEEALRIARERAARG